jgi:S-adenosylmethionine:tRNA ribosyltransferase-isomerase
MVVDRAKGTRLDSGFARLIDWLRPGDVVVRNDTRVLRARLRGTRRGGGELEVLLLEHESGGGRGEGEVWTCLARPGRRLRPNETARLDGGIAARWLDEPDEQGIRRAHLLAPRPIVELLEEVGEVPLPPYIERAPTERDAETYQTVYSANPGAVAAPTAGLHFTNEMLAAIAAHVASVVSLTLHVGPSTFLPVRTADVERHRLGSERIEIPEATLDAVRTA